MIQKIQPQSLDLQTFHRPDLLLSEMLQLTYSPFSLSYVALPIDSVVQARTLNQTTNVTIHIRLNANARCAIHRCGFQELLCLILYHQRDEFSPAHLHRRRWCT
jgi:hypothetical protein